MWGEFRLCTDLLAFNFNGSSDYRTKSVRARKNSTKLLRVECFIMIKITHSIRTQHRRNLILSIPLDRPRKICRLFNKLLLFVELCGCTTQTNTPSMSSHCKCSRMNYESHHNGTPTSHTLHVNHTYFATMNIEQTHRRHTTTVANLLIPHALCTLNDSNTIGLSDLIQSQIKLGALYWLIRSINHLALRESDVSGQWLVAGATETMSSGALNWISVLDTNARGCRIISLLTHEEMKRYETDAFMDL